MDRPADDNVLKYKFDTYIYIYDVYIYIHTYDYNTCIYIYIYMMNIYIYICVYIPLLSSYQQSTLPSCRALVVVVVVQREGGCRRKDWRKSEKEG